MFYLFLFSVSEWSAKSKEGFGILASTENLSNTPDKYFESTQLEASYMQKQLKLFNPNQVTGGAVDCSVTGAMESLPALLSVEVIFLIVIGP